MIGLRPSFFLFLLMAAVDVATAAAAAAGEELSLVLLPLADPPPAAPVIDGALAAVAVAIGVACCAWGAVCLVAGRAFAVDVELVAGVAPAPAPALSWSVCCPPFMVPGAGLGLWVRRRYRQMKKPSRDEKC